jgi:hypothetical protein
MGGGGFPGFSGGGFPGGGNPPPVVADQTPQEDPVVTELKRTEPEMFGELSPEQQAVIVHLIKTHGCDFEVALDKASEADYDPDLADAMFDSMDPAADAQ